MSTVTIYEIAEEAGCSASTVSRVINGYPYVKKATRNKILKIIERRNFVPNATARNLVNQSTRMLGILIADLRTAQHTDGIVYIERELSKLGYSCIICNTGPEANSIKSYIQMLSERNVEGIIMMGSIYQSDAVKEALELYMPDIPTVLCNGYIESDNIYGIIADEESGVFDAVKLLERTECKNIAFILDHKTPSNLKKVDGYQKALKEDGIILYVPDELAEMKNAIKEFIEVHNDIDGIIFSEDYIALVALNLFSEMSIKVPERISVIAINNSRYAEIGIPPLTSIDNKLYDTSITAVRTILALLNGEETSKKILLQTEIIERKTTKSLAYKSCQ